MNGKLNIENCELNKYIHQKRKDSEKLFNFIDTKVHPKIRKQLIFLIEKYIEDYSKYTSVENMLHYKVGFSDAIKVVVTSLKIWRRIYLWMIL